MSFARLLLLVCLCLHGRSIGAEAGPPPNKDQPSPLTACIDKNLGFKIKCDPNWPRNVQAEGLQFLLANRPLDVATLSITRYPGLKWTLQDLTPTVLRLKFHYTKDLRIGQTKVGGNKAIAVHSQPLGYPEVQMTDYFLIRDDDLYRVSFTASARLRQKEHEPLFAELIRSFEFVQMQEPALSFRLDSAAPDEDIPQPTDN
jgi:hypothetical protein